MRAFVLLKASKVEPSFVLCLALMVESRTDFAALTITSNLWQQCNLKI